ncbi:MAG: vWA domain-containing protein, partial [Nannocystaceae bacterium]
MTLLSLDWAGLLGLFAAPAAVIIALYLLKEQRPVIVVPFVQLWNKVLSQERARQPWLRLRRFRSLLWQLAMLAALVLAFANPSFERWTGHPRRYIAVLDTSASMGAPSSNPTRWQTRLDEAVDIIRTESSELGGRDRAALVLAGAGVSVRATLGPVADLHEAIDAPLNTSGGASLKEAISIAIAMSAETPEQTWIRVFSDREAPLTFSKRCRATSLACTWTRLGSTSDNIALTAFAARRSHRTPELVDMSAEIHNFGGSPATVQLQIAAATLPLETVTVDLPADGSERVSLRGLEAPQEVFTAKIEPAEGSPALPGVAYDDIAYATVAPRSRLRIAKVSDRQNLFLDAVLLALDAEFELVSSSFAKVRADPTKLDEFDLVVVDASD